MKLGECYFQKTKVFRITIKNLTHVVQLTLEQYEFELHESAYMQTSFNKYIGKTFGDLWQFDKNIFFFSLDYCENTNKQNVC